MTFSAFELQSVPPAPGRGDDATAPTTHTAQPIAPSGGSGSGAGGTLGAVFPFLLVIPMVLIMLFMGRSQQKKQKDLESKLKAGDQVLTQSGLVGKLTEKGERYAKVEIAPGIKVKMLKSALVGLDTGEETTRASVADKS